MNAEVLDRLVAELAALEPMDLVLSPATTFQFVALMQLALRHPDLPEHARVAAERFLRGARVYFQACPTVLEVVRQGDDPAYDVPSDADPEAEVFLLAWAARRARYEEPDLRDDIPPPVAHFRCASCRADIMVAEGYHTHPALCYDCLMLERLHLLHRTGVALVRPATDAEMRAALDAELTCRCRSCGHRAEDHAAFGVCRHCGEACWS